MEALDRASPCRRRGTQSWPGAPRAHGQIGESWGRPSFGMTSSRRLQVRMESSWKLFVLISLPQAIAPSTTVLRSARRRDDQGGGFPPMSVSLQGMGASRRSSIHLSPSQASDVGASQKTSSADSGYWLCLCQEIAEILATIRARGVPYSSPATHFISHCDKFCGNWEPCCSDYCDLVLSLSVQGGRSHVRDLA